MGWLGLGAAVGGAKFQRRLGWITGFSSVLDSRTTKQQKCGKGLSADTHTMKARGEKRWEGEEKTKNQDGTWI